MKAGESIGTGIITTSDGEIVTNAHVVADASNVRVRLAGETKPHEARLVAIDVGNDLALLRIAGSRGSPPLRFADPGAMRHRRRGGGDRLRARPRRSGRRSRSASCRGLDRTVGSRMEQQALDGLIQTDAADLVG